MGAYGIPGDPEQMRRVAAQIRSEALGAAVLGTRVQRTADGMHWFAGRAARRFRGDVAEWQFGRSGFQARLEHAIEVLVREADRVEEAQREARLQALRMGERRP